MYKGKRDPSICPRVYFELSRTEIKLTPDEFSMKKCWQRHSYIDT